MQPWLLLLILSCLVTLLDRCGAARAPLASRRRLPSLRRSVLLWAALLIAYGATSPALAQTAAPQAAAINAQLFRPAIGPEDIITVTGTRTPGTLKPMLNILFEYADQPLRLVAANGSVLAVPVSSMTSVHVMAGLGLTRWLALSFDLPVALYQTAGMSSPLVPNTPSVAGLGDFRLVFKARIVNNEEGGFGLAFVPQAMFPTGGVTDFRSSSTTARSVYLIEPRLALDYRWRRGTILALNGGFQARVCSSLDSACDQDFYSARVSHLVTYGLGLFIPLAKGVGIGGDVIGAYSIHSSTASGDTFLPLEAYGVLRWTHRSGFMLNAGGGGSPYLEAAGSPRYRVFAGLGYLPFGKRATRVEDRDNDGIPDISDACPDEPGPPSKDPGQNGCPRRDRDGDGVLDDVDQCPDQPQGDHPDPKRPGCPLTDRDGDGVYDDVDQCPDQPQGNHPDPKRPGCPLTDRDGDGVYDDVDQCPDVVAGPHPDANRPGCPDKDTDGDGVFDSMDQCPQEPAGLNPDPQRRGCPLPDRDHDMVPDAVDACPDQPGAPSPDPKKNGCPGIVQVRDGMIVILKEIFFATNKDVIQKKSYPVLQAVADTLAAVASIKKIGIEGHTDNRGKRDHNISLSDSRAVSVMRWLVEHGVSAERLEAKGYGPDRPIADNKTKAGQAKNRRVDFRIIDPPQAVNAAPAPSAQDTVPDAAPKAKGSKGHNSKKAKKGATQE